MLQGFRVEPGSVAASIPATLEEDGISFRTFPEPEEGGRVPRALPAELLRLTFQNRLRAIGRHLDINDFRSVLIFQVEGGFVVRCFNRVTRDVDLIEFTDASHPERMIEATEARGEGERQESPSPIAPTGYEDLLRAVGRLIDERGAANSLVIAEKGDSVVILGEDVVDGRSRPFEVELDEAGITAVLDEAFRLRTSSERDGNGV